MGPLRLTVQTEPAIEPLTLSEVKVHLRYEEDDDINDLELLAMLTAARQHVEQITRRALINTTFDWYHDYFLSRFIVPRGPLSSVSAITYTDPDGATQTVSSSVYTVDTDHDPGQIYLAYNQSWPSARTDDKAVKIRFVAGYGSTRDSVPEPIRRALLVIIADMDEQRQEGVIGTINSRVDIVRPLLDPYRCGWF